MARARTIFTYNVKTLRGFYVERKNFAGVPFLAAALVLGAAAGCASVKANRLAVPDPERWTTTASAAEVGNGQELAVDGRTNTWWRSGDEGPQWIQVGWPRPALVCGFSLHWGRPHATAYAVETSLDGAQWTLAFETENGDGHWDQAAFEPIMARHLRLRVARSALGRRVALAELEIQDVEDRPRMSVDGLPDPAAAALLDGDAETSWRCARAAADVELDLRRAESIGSLRVDWGAAGYASNVVVETSADGTNWTSFGRIQVQAGDFDVLMRDEAAEARFVRLAFSGASAPDGFEVAGISLRGEEGTAQPWALLEVAAQHAPEGLYPDVLRRRQTYWTVAAGPRPGDAESLLDESGTFAPHADAATLTPLLAVGGELLSAQQAAERDYRLGGAGAPLPETTWKFASDLTLRIRALARSGAAAPTTWVKYELANESLMAQTGRLVWAVRPIRLAGPGPNRSGLAPIHRIRAAEAGDWQEIRVNDVPLFAVPRRDLPFGAASFADGDVVEGFRRGETPAARAATDGNGLASAAWWLDFALEPGSRTSVVVVANAQTSIRRRFPWATDGVTPDAVAEAFDRDWVDAAWTWRSETSRYYPRIARPEALDGLRAQVGWLLGRRAADGENLETTTGRVPALLRAGQPDVAREWIERVAAGIRTNGWVPDRLAPRGASAEAEFTGRHAQQGQFAFMVMEYHRFTQDTAFLQKRYPQLVAAMRVLERLRADLEKTEWQLAADEAALVEGLLPPTPARDGGRALHRYADQYWALLGWKEVRAAAALLGRDDDAVWADANYRALKSAVRRSLRARMDLMDASWIPAAAEDGRLDAGSVALLFWPCAETDLVEPHELQSSLDAFYETVLARGEPDGERLAPADDAALLGPLAAMGRGDYAREVFVSLLAAQRPPGWQSWPRARNADPRQPGPVGDMPDLRVAAAYVMGTRGLAVRENGKKLDLFCGAPAEWLQHGDGFQVYGMPTAFGPLDLAGYWQKKQFTVDVGGGAQPSGGYRVWWPRQVRPERVLANGERVAGFDALGCDLPHDFKGRLEAFMPYSAPWPREP
ncbi:MAG: discoidin domain-containing protein [Spartobacteria bacterium]|nr:discoidin domain-containing protein [Spartobacteria bacterium]